MSAISGPQSVAAGRDGGGLRESLGGGGSSLSRSEWRARRRPRLRAGVCRRTTPYKVAQIHLGAAGYSGTGLA